MILEDLGCQVSLMLLENSGGVFVLGSELGTTFLSSNPEIGYKFSEYFGKCHIFSL